MTFRTALQTSRTLTIRHTSNNFFLLAPKINSFWSEGGQPLGQRTMRPQKSNNGTLRNDKTCSWRGQSGTHDLQMSCPLLALHRIEYCFRWVWKAALASLVVVWCLCGLVVFCLVVCLLPGNFCRNSFFHIKIPVVDRQCLVLARQCRKKKCIGLFDFIHTPDHMSLWHLYMVTLASVADPRLFDPRVGDDKTFITTMSMQQTSVHGRTTSCHKTGWEDRTWGYPSLSSGFST